MTPRPLERGDQAHLTWGSIRWSVARQMRLGVELAAQAGDPAVGQYAALLAGADVVLTRKQVASFVPPTRRPTGLEAHELWLLRGDDELTAQDRG